jgi:2-polyprenyl-6-methoxyphenol hydroxylase-like FAD-dependent oxidoreductase
MTLPYDVITVGGGLAGSALAKCLAERGYRVLVLERETRFKDRVRGEQMHPWGVTEARTLGIYQRLGEACGHQTRWWTRYQGPTSLRRRDLAQTTPHGVGSFNFYHPEMQETLLRMAAEAGAEVRRGASVNAVTPGRPPSVSFRENGQPRELHARLVVGADGRASQVRRWAGFTVARDPDRLTIAGALVEAPRIPDDGVHLAGGPTGRVLIAPQRRQRVRMYFMSPTTAGSGHLSGKSHEADFLRACRDTGAPSEWFDTATIVGPLAQFNGADHWVDQPAHGGVALIGDAASASDPSFGCGLSLALLGVRQLRDCLFASENWDIAIEQYAREHDHAYGVVRRLTNWLTELLYGAGSAADQRRARVFPRLAAEPERAPDIVGLGPASPSDEAARRFVLGEDDE